jgi:signal recognition particle subunit SRP54
LTALSPGEQVIKIVRDELVETLGHDTARMKFASQPPTVILMAGLQGSGKTTTSGKLANWLKNGGHRPLLVSVDVYRPAAREQLKVVAQAVKAQIYEGEVGEADTATQLTQAVERLVKEARREAIVSGCDVLIVDTAGRLHIDDELMSEMQSLKKLLNPSEILFVADAMTGQDAVRSADEFHKKLSLTGVVLTKMDGDARGGAALSIRQVTGQPIKFIGVGEKYDALEPFHPDRIVSRILGMGDILSLIERAEQQIDKKKAQEMATKALTGDGFSLEDFRDQLRQVKKMGSMKSLMGMLPSIGPFSGLQKAADNVDEKQINRVEAIINSMTTYERNHHEVINGNRRKRIARGSGTSVQEVNNLLRQYAQMKKMFKQMGKPSFARRLAGMKLPGM